MGMVASTEPQGDQGDGGVIYLTIEEGREMFDRSAHRIAGMGGEEFLRRWDAGEFDSLERTDPDRWDRFDNLAAVRDFAGL
jgi:hypothetical protein